tara:strand:+ start:788 stop:1600 length:813 start_codon:yes stop_codon:yes gene_type:complete
MERKKLLKNEVAKMFNTTGETLRHYENKGLISPEVTEKKYRLYDNEDLQMLRQIFLFKDLELSLDEMKELFQGDLDEALYKDLLSNHYDLLGRKIDRLKRIQGDISQLMSLVENEKATLSFMLREQKQRNFYVLDKVDAEIMESPKKYYDKFREIIVTKNYTERTLQMLYKYSDLSLGQRMISQICIEIPQANSNSMEIPEGLYLSVFYPFKHDFADLPDLKTQIDEYIKKNKLVRVGDSVLEIEHPELSIYLDKGTTVFELQIKVEKKS